MIDTPHTRDQWYSILKDSMEPAEEAGIADTLFEMCMIDFKAKGLYVHTLDEVKQGYAEHVESCGKKYKPWLYKFVVDKSVLYNLETVQNIVLTDLNIHTSDNLFRHVCKYGSDDVGYLVTVYECGVDDWCQMLSLNNTADIQAKVRKEFRSGCMIVDDLDGVFEYFKSGGNILGVGEITRLYADRKEISVKTRKKGVRK